MATAGQDFGDYKSWMNAVNIDTSLVKVIDGKFCASFFCSTDQASNQIASFYTGAMANAGELSMRTVEGISDALVIISPNDPDAMVQWAEECAAMGVKYIWDPGPAVRAHGGIAAEERRHRRVHGDLQRLRIRADSPEDRHGRGRHPRARAAARDHEGREGLLDSHEGRRRRRGRGAARSHRGSDRRRRRVPRRVHEGPGDGRAVPGLCPARQRRRHLRARASRRHVACVHLGRVQAPLRDSISARCNLGRVRLY